MEPKAKTLIERLGFLDPDRRSQNHDSIQLWVHDNIENVIMPFVSDSIRINVLGKQLEKPIFSESISGHKSVVGFIDLFVFGYFESPFGNRKRFDLSIEVKCSIKSCGDLIRQVNFYRTLEKSPTSWMVVSPEYKFEDILKSQKIGFYHFKQRSGQLSLQLH